MFINFYNGLELSLGAYIAIVYHQGNEHHGYFQGDFDNTKNTFLFENHSTGKTETIHLDKLQSIRKVWD